MITSRLNKLIFRLNSHKNLLAYTKSFFSDTTIATDGEMIKFKIHNLKTKEITEVEAPEGTSILKVAHK